MKAGDKVVMNEKYVVAEEYRGKVFTVRSHPFDICGTECVLLEGYSGGFAVDGLTLVERQSMELQRKKDINLGEKGELKETISVR